MYRFDTNGQLTMLDLDTAERGGAPPKRRPGKPDSELVSIPYFHLDLLSPPVDLFGQRHWELRSPWREGKRPLNTGAAPRRPIRVSLSGILEAYPALKYYLSKTACLGILRRAFERGKDLPKMLANDRFTALLRAGVDVKTAYEVVDGRALVANAMRYAIGRAREKTIGDIRARLNRPQENGADGGGATRIGPPRVKDMTRKQREEIEKRCARGEKVFFD